MSTTLTNGVAAAQGHDVRPDPAAPLAHDFTGNLIERFLKQEGGLNACVSGTESWTYAELRAASAVIALKIGRHPADRRRPVAIYARRQPMLVAAIFGIIRSGHPFLILDPKHPAARNQRCIQLARPLGILSLAPHSEIPGFLLDELKALDHAFIHDLSAGKLSLLEPGFTGTPENSFPGDQAAPDDVMYWAFTSGTTGSPRAIIGGFGPVGHFFAWQQKTFGLTSGDRFSVLSGLAHDPLLRDVLLPLWVGGSNYFPPEEHFGLPGRLYEWMQINRITISHLTPSMGHLLLSGRAVEKYGPLQSLKGAFFGGDILRLGLAHDFAACAPSARIVNCYGTSETPQIMAYHEAPRQEVLEGNEPGDRQKLLPIGKGIEGCQLLVLNDDLALCTVGEEGDIFVRTPHRALNILDGEKPVTGAYQPNPFSREPGDLLYRTGDRGEYLADGSVRHKGRKDRQVKIRGFRIALEELENALAQDGRIAQFQIELDDSHAENRLLLFMVARPEADLKADEIRERLQSQLPGYMVPERICVLPAMPLTPNGKVDHARLKNMTEDTLGAGLESVPGDTDIEGALIKMVGSALFAKSVSSNTDIVKAGMNSLQAIEISCAIEEKFGLALSAAEIVQHSTISRLAVYIRQLKDKTAPPIPSGTEVAAMLMNIEGHVLASKTDGSHGVGPQLFPKNERLLTGIKNRVFQLLARVAPDVWRVKLHRARGVSIGKNASIGYDSIVETSYPWLVSIGDDVNIGIRVTIIAHFRGMVPVGKQKHTVTIENDAFVGPGVFILPNVTIGEGAVIAAGSVVNESVPPYTLVQGNPAKPKARCGLPLSKAVSYAEFVANLKPIS
jgi:non-ribosomal peptide synthetase component F/acetyltransferase-like isoleucine patch superfamily enzyme/acyl carrier protein